LGVVPDGIFHLPFFYQAAGALPADQGLVALVGSFVVYGVSNCFISNYAWVAIFNLGGTLVIWY